MPAQGKPAPVIYILQGDDEFAIARYVSEMEAKLGDPSLAAMNISRLDGRTFNLDDLLGVAGAMPFLSPRRLVVLSQVVERLKDTTKRERFLSQLHMLPVTTALVMVEIGEKDRRQNREHWLDRWATEQGERVLNKTFMLPKGAAMADRIQKEARIIGGEISRQAAEVLADLVGDDPRLAVQEIHKLLAYVNYNRPVEPEDVETLTIDSNPGNIFEMIDALSTRNGFKAVEMLHRLLEQEDPMRILAMIHRQFRLLIQARELLDEGKGGQITQVLKMVPFVAEKTAAQARRFDMDTLETAYQRLLDLDEGIKSGQIEADVAIDTFVVAFTG